MSVWDLKRNDVKGALAEAERLMKAGEFYPDTAQVLIMLHDDPEEYLKGFKKLAKKYDFVKL